MKKTVLREYAKLIVRTGLNVQKGQTVLVVADLDQPEFVQMVVEEAYKAKAKEVMVQWTYQPLAKLHYRYRTVKSLGTLKDWEKARQEFYCEELPARVYLMSEDPDGLKGINMTKMVKAQQMLHPIMKGYRDRRDNKEQWCIAAVPGKAWAKKVFPGLRTSMAIEKLWEVILKCARVDGDAIANWDAHNASMAAHCKHLNDLKIRQLHFYADNGTDLTVGLISESRWRGGGDTSLQGIYYNPNIPTEECFISPMKGQAEGIVYSTKPLSYQGQLIDNFWIRFENGKAVDSGAEQNAELLKSMLTMDEGAAMLGECALVPQHSPICESGILFYNTLFDENAACHLAMGMGFADTIVGFENKTLEECREMGINDSMIHEDFMIGCDTMNIDGVCEDGSTVAIFRQGNWAF